MLEQPKLIFSASIKRKLFVRRFLWSLLAALAALAGIGALALAAGRPELAQNRTLLTIGQITAALVCLLFALRALLNLWRALRRKSEELRFFDRGFMWQQGKTQHKYSWAKLAAFREGGSGIYLRKRVLLQWGRYTLRMQDGKVFRVDGLYGDLRRFGKAVRRFAARSTGTQMARALREDDTAAIKLHRSLTVYANGLGVGSQSIGWENVDVKLHGRRLLIYRKNAKGVFKPFKRYRLGAVDNLGGLMELATTTIRHHQPDRFNIKVQVPVVRPAAR